MKDKDKDKPILFLLRSMIASFSFLFCSIAMAEWHEDYHIEGYDVVSYYDETGPQRGLRALTLKHEGQLYAFSSTQNIDKFLSDPERYVPAYDGNCAYGMAYAKQSSIDPLVWKIVDNRLFFHINQSTAKRWDRKADSYIRKSDRVWARLSQENNDS